MHEACTEVRRTVVWPDGDGAGCCGPRPAPARRDSSPQCFAGVFLLPCLSTRLTYSTLSPVRCVVYFQPLRLALAVAHRRRLHAGRKKRLRLGLGAIYALNPPFSQDKVLEHARLESRVSRETPDVTILYLLLLARRSTVNHHRADRDVTAPSRTDSFIQRKFSVPFTAGAAPPLCVAA